MAPRGSFGPYGPLPQSPPPTSAVARYTPPPNPRPKPSIGMVEPGNIDIGTRPVVKNSDGSVSTVRTISINVDGNEILIPTVSDDGHILSDDAAIDLFRKTGNHFGVFGSIAAADEAAQALHDQQARMTTMPRFKPQR